jgi:hypothetical protein
VLTSVRHLDHFLMKIRPFGQPATSVVLSTVVEHPLVHPSATYADEDLGGAARPWRQSSQLEVLRRAATR